MKLRHIGVVPSNLIAVRVYGVIRLSDGEIDIRAKRSVVSDHALEPQRIKIEHVLGVLNSDSTGNLTVIKTIEFAFNRKRSHFRVKRRVNKIPRYRDMLGSTVIEGYRCRIRKIRGLAG